MMRACSLAAAVWLSVCGAGLAASLADDPVHACDRAATRAEKDWNLPERVLSAIGIVESGRRDLGAGGAVPWPWTINADRKGTMFPNKEEAIGVVRAMQALGRRVIDVGCFQVDLYYHPEAFANLEEAFDPEMNAQAAARILSQSRLSSPSWDNAIALYHSASPLLGGQYLRQVQSVWPLARSRPVVDADIVYAVLLSDAARQVRVLTPADAANPPPGMPRVVTPQTATGVVQWTSMPAGGLPVVVPPPPRPGRRAAPAPFPKP
jgi:hypothetical protein